MIAAAITGHLDSATPPAGLTHTQNVLLVHRDKTEMERLARYLGDAYHLFAVRTELQLLTALEEEPSQLIILHAEPGYRQDGIRICSRLRSMPRFAYIPVILVIAANDHQARIASLEAGADAWIERPLSRDYLRAQIKALLAGRRRLKSYFSLSSWFDQYPVSATVNNPSFLSRLHTIILEHLPDTGFDIGLLARQMNVSRPTLYRKIRSISDRTPNEWVNVIRLNKAAELLSGSDIKILEIAKMVGFHSRSNFGKAFLKHFGVAPMEYRQRSNR